MSYPGVDPADAAETNPVGTQDASGGVALDSAPTPPKLAEAVVDTPPAEAEVKEAVAKAVEDIFAINESAWAPKKIVKFKIDCPSGQTALVKHLDTMDLIEHDLVEELDFFMRKLFPAEIDPAGNPVEAHERTVESIWEALGDPEKRKRFLDVTGRLIATAAIKPRVVHDGVAVVPSADQATGEPTKATKFGYELSVKEQIEHFGKPIAPLPSGAVYSGYIDFADRMAFFQELNKPLGQIEPFREEQVAVLQDMARSEGSGDTT